MSCIDLLGDSLLKPDGSTVSKADALKGVEVLGLYFSAHWCPPCRGFTPMLSKKYTELQAAGKSFELVFVSSDKDEAQFKDYHKEMTFLALPYELRDAKAKLSKDFKVQGIPTLVFVDAATGQLITNEGREAISADNFIEKFPYKPVPVDVVAELGALLRKPDGSSAPTSEALAGKDYLAIYFSAHWCPPCRGFTPTLCKQYTALQEAGKSFEMVFVSSDKDEGQFNEYHGEMTFLAMPYERRDAKETLSKYFKVQGIPSLVFMNLKTGQLITANGRAGVSSDTFVEDFPYFPKPVYDLSEDLDGINDTASIIVLCETASADEKAEISNVVLQIATDELKKPEDDRRVGKFFTGKGGGPLEKIKSACGYASATTPVMLILNLADEGAYYHPAAGQEACTKANMEAFMAAVKTGAARTGTFGA